MPRVARGAQKSRHDPLLVQLGNDEIEAKYGRVSQPGKRQKSSRNDDEGDSEVILDPKTSKRIFELAKVQQDEMEVPDDDEDIPQSPGELSRPRLYPEDEEEDEGSSIGEEPGDVEEEFQIDSGDLKTLDALLPPNAGERRTLADIIFSKLTSGETTNVAMIQKVNQGKFCPADSESFKNPDPALGLDPRIVESYRTVGALLRSYRSGPLPKIFKIIPSLPAWARILALTNPESWSPHACRAATKMFISNMKPAQAQLFLNVVLLDAIRADIRENKKLNVHYYASLKKALYKPGAFFKGLIFPLLDQGCTLKEAAIVASVLAKTKVPVLHSSAALLRIAEMDYSGPNSLFIRVLVDKKYELPYKVIDALVFHYIRLSNNAKTRTRESEKLPVLWHQSLLSFAQRYSSDLTPEQKDMLLDVVRANPHPQISHEVRRELVNSVPRGAPRLDGDADVAMA
ncbi:hypothetical protein AX14_000221 [Amanita brunnescens Koide BX004]|nr:hypothetical protein AX14_000221 [Amanita brunnescens Koide BX004]